MTPELAYIRDSLSEAVKILPDEATLRAVAVAAGKDFAAMQVNYRHLCEAYGEPRRTNHPANWADEMAPSFDYEAAQIKSLSGQGNKRGSLSSAGNSVYDRGAALAGEMRAVEEGGE